MTNIHQVNDVQKQAKQLLANTNALKPELVEEFNSLFKEATASVANVSGQDFELKRRKKVQQDIEKGAISLDKVDQSYLAQLNTGVVGNAQQANAKDLNIVPLQIFLDNAIRSLERVSQQEFRVNDLMDGFVRGDISEDEVVLETAKLNLSISMITTIVQSAVTTFKEIQQIPV